MRFRFSATVLAGVLLGIWQPPLLDRIVDVPEARAQAAQASQDAELGAAFRTRRSGFQVWGTGVVTRILADDEGGRHQRFILMLASGQTLLVAHNIDIAPRIGSLRTGDPVSFNGVYEWNDKGGVIHWTHRDPSRRHTPGWLRHAGLTYQ